MFVGFWEGWGGAGAGGVGSAVDKSLLGWLCDLTIRTENTHQVTLALLMSWREGGRGAGGSVRWWVGVQR